MSGHIDHIYASERDAVRVESGETWENKLIHLGDGGNISVVATGTNWTIRNVGVTGTWHHVTHESLFGLGDTGGGTSVVENVYIGDGDPSAGSGERGNSMWVTPNHSGTLTIRNVNFNIEGALGVYGSPPGRNSGGNRGDVHIDNCYARDAHHTAYRVSGNNDSVRNCVAYKTGNRAALRGVYVERSPSGGNTTLENVDVVTNGAGVGVSVESPSQVTMNGVRTDDGTGDGGSPDHYVPEGVPTDAEMAANGDGGGGGGSPAPDPYTDPSCVRDIVEQL